MHEKTERATRPVLLLFRSIPFPRPVHLPPPSAAPADAGRKSTAFLPFHPFPDGLHDIALHALIGSSRGALYLRMCFRLHPDRHGFFCRQIPRISAPFCIAGQTITPKKFVLLIISHPHNSCNHVKLYSSCYHVLRSFHKVHAIMKFLLDIRRMFMLS